MNLSLYDETYDFLRDSKPNHAYMHNDSAEILSVPAKYVNVK